MSDYEIGYAKPPKASQFKPGVSGNPAGRPPKKIESDLPQVIIKVLNSLISHREGEKVRKTPAWELNLAMRVRQAVRGDVDAAMAVLKFSIRAQRSKAGRHRVVIEDWLPDYPGQTAEQKTLELARKKNAAPVEWWSKPSETNDD